MVEAGGVELRSLIENTQVVEKHEKHDPLKMHKMHGVYTEPSDFARAFSASKAR